MSIYKIKLNSNVSSESKGNIIILSDGSVVDAETLYAKADLDGLEEMERKLDVERRY